MIESNQKGTGERITRGNKVGVLRDEKVAEK